MAKNYDTRRSGKNIRGLIEMFERAKAGSITAIFGHNYGVIMLPKEKFDRLNDCTEIVKEAKKNRSKLIFDLGLINMSILTPREQKIIELRFIEMMTYQEIAREFEVTRDRIKQIEEKAIDKIKRSYAI